MFMLEGKRCLLHSSQSLRAGLHRKKDSGPVINIFSYEGFSPSDALFYEETTKH